ncbi:MAG: IMP dehydrogenase [bacterium]
MHRNAVVRSFMDRLPDEGLTFDDVSLVTQYADFLPDQADLSARFTRRITLNIPFVSAAMDTVTEAPMAIAMALLGGIGIIHKNLTAQEQARHVSTVKHYLNGLILAPIAFHSDQTLEQILAIKAKKGYQFNGFPILDASEKVVGILTSSDLKFATDFTVRAHVSMTSTVITAPPATTLQEAYTLMRKHRIGKLPLVDDKGHLTGLYSYTDVRTLIENVHPQYTRDALHRLRVGAAIGPGDQDRVERLVHENVDAVVVDTAHGHSQGVLDMVRWVKKHYPDLEVIAGNIATADAALALRDAGADAVKVGIGPGSICTTRIVAGVGVPQITAIYACASALKGEIPIIADGGVRYSGDVPKALVAGADTVMAGSLFAGTDESPGEKIIHQGRQYVVYRGMGSLAAMREGAASRERYGQTSSREDELVPQGIEGIVPYSGSVKKVMTQFCGGVRAAMGYCGCRTIAELQSRGRFVRVSFAGMQEAHAHNVKIIKEAPNYQSASSGV